MLDVPFLYDCFVRLMGGIPLALKLSLSSIALGFVLAVMLALAMREA